MGVVYKLTDDVIQYILAQKKEFPQSSCRELVEKVAAQFQKKVSKSAVHEILKEAHIISPRGRKVKSKFAIPDEKKAQLKANLLLPSVKAPSPPPTPAIIVKPVVVEERPKAARIADKPLKPLEPLEQELLLSEIIKRIAFFDLFPKPWRGVMDYKSFEALAADMKEDELQYRKTPIAAFKIELEDGCCFYIDSMMQHIDSNMFTNENLCTPIERALECMADCFGNNIQPIVIKEFTGNFLGASFYDFLSACQAKKGKQIASIMLLGQKSEQVTEFKGVMSIERHFIIGVSTQVPDIKELVNAMPDVPDIVIGQIQEQTLFVAKPIELAGIKLRGIVIVDKDRQPIQVVLSNMPSSFSDGDLIRLFHLQHPPQLILEENSLSGVKKDIEGEFLINDPLTASVYGNADVCLVNVTMPNQYGHTQDLVALIEGINARYIKDDQGRRIYIKTVAG